METSRGLRHLVLLWFYVSYVVFAAATDSSSIITSSPTTTELPSDASAVVVNTTATSVSPTSVAATLDNVVEATAALQTHDTFISVSFDHSVFSPGTSDIVTTSASILDSSDTGPFQPQCPEGLLLCPDGQCSQTCNTSSAALTTSESGVQSTVTSSSMTIDTSETSPLPSTSTAVIESSAPSITSTPTTLTASPVPSSDIPTQSYGTDSIMTTSSASIVATSSVVSTPSLPASSTPRLSVSPPAESLTSTPSVEVSSPTASTVDATSIAATPSTDVTPATDTHATPSIETMFPGMSFPSDPDSTSAPSSSAADSSATKPPSTDTPASTSNVTTAPSTGFDGWNALSGIDPKDDGISGIPVETVTDSSSAGASTTPTTQKVVPGGPGFSIYETIPTSTALDKTEKVTADPNTAPTPDVTHAPPPLPPLVTPFVSVTELDKNVLPDEHKPDEVIITGTGGEQVFVDPIQPDAGLGVVTLGTLPPSPPTGDDNVIPGSDWKPESGFPFGDLTELSRTTTKRPTDTGSEDEDLLNKLQLLFLVAPCLAALLALIGLACVIRYACRKRCQRRQQRMKLKRETKKFEKEQKAKMKAEEAKAHEENETKKPEDEEPHKKKHRKHRHHHKRHDHENEANGHVAPMPEEHGSQQVESKRRRSRSRHH